MFKSYYQQFGAFGCFDDCFNFVAAKFMLRGKPLYSEIFFNHQPLGAYLSYSIQGVLEPKTAYQLIFDHRIFVLLFSFSIDILIIYRFRWAGIGFVLFYELTKFYFFGDRFLAEAMIAQPLVYLWGVAWYKIQNRSLLFSDFLLSGILTWFVVFMREPYIPVALFLFILILWNRKFLKLKFISLFTFLLLSIITLGFVNLREYFFQVFKLNIDAVVSKSGGGSGLRNVLTSFFYPFEIILTGKETFIRQILIGVDLVFLTLMFFSFKLQKYKEVVFIFLVLGFSATRTVLPGTMFYEAFHMLPWYGLFLISVFLLFGAVFKSLNRKVVYLLFFLLLGTLVISLLPTRSFIWDKIDRQKLFNTNYAYYFTYGEAIKILSNQKDELFVDVWDDFIYWQADLNSSYKYSLYTPLMVSFTKYKNARTQMFNYNSPDFYYTHCDNGKLLFPSAVLPKNKEKDYKQLYTNGKPACLFIKKTKLSKITDKKWKETEKLGFYLYE